jgi:5-methylcytosine-specific restriction endonuclease McrA
MLFTVNQNINKFMNDNEIFKFKSIYKLADLVEESVECDMELFNYNPDIFIEISTRFSKFSLLHFYIIVAALNHYRREFRKNGDCIDEDTLEGYWYDLFESYEVEIRKYDFDSRTDIFIWFNKNIDQFELLFSKMAEEAFYVLFANREFLLNFNNLITKTITGTVFPPEFITAKGTIKRIAIPKWVKTAVFHRDKGRCVFCNTDLTGLINTLTSSNYDHIVPLDLHGTNDPCNIQLTCERCNKSKTNKIGTTSNKYIPWWPQ